MRGTTFTQAAKRAFKSALASLSASSAVAQVLRITILSVIKKSHKQKSVRNPPKQCYYYLPGRKSHESLLRQIRLSDRLGLGGGLCIIRVPGAAEPSRP